MGSLVERKITTIRVEAELAPSIQGAGAGLTFGLGTDDSYTGTITVTPPGTVYGPFPGGGGGAPICVASITVAEGTVVTFDANPVNIGASWASNFFDQISVGGSDPLVTTINNNLDFGVPNPCGEAGHVYFQSFA